MNQTQRKFLLDAVDKQFKAESGKLSARKPKEPSLNNYLIAAVLDGSFVMKDQATVRQLLKERVRKLGKDDALLETSKTRWGSDREDKDRSKGNIIIPAELMFDLPAGYVEAFKEFEEALARWEEENDALEAAANAMRIKIQIGSDKALEALVDQADTICTMSLASANKLLLNGPTK